MGVLDWFKDQQAQAQWGPNYKKRQVFATQQRQLALKKMMMGLAIQKSQLAANRMLQLKRGTGALGNLTAIGMQGSEGAALPPELMKFLGPEAEGMGLDAILTGQERGGEKFETDMGRTRSLTEQSTSRGNLADARLMELTSRLPGRMKTETARGDYYRAGATRSRASAARSDVLSDLDKRKHVVKGLLDTLKEIAIQENNEARVEQRAPRPVFGPEMHDKVLEGLEGMDFFRDVAGQQIWDEDGEEDEFSGGGLSDTGFFPGDDTFSSLEDDDDEDEGREGGLLRLMQYLGMGGGQ